MSIPREDEVVRLRVFRLMADNRPGALLADQISDPMTAYEAAMKLTREQGEPMTDEQWQRFFGRARRLVDEPAPAEGESPVWILANKPSGIMWAVVWRDANTEAEFGALAALEEQDD